MSIGSCGVFRKEDAIAWFDLQTWNHCATVTYNPPQTEKFWEGTHVKPLNLDEYKTIWKKWDGRPVFKLEDGTFVQLYNPRTLNDNPDIRINIGEGFFLQFTAFKLNAEIPETWFKFERTNDPVVKKVKLVFDAAFSDFKRFAEIAWGLRKNEGVPKVPIQAMRTSPNEKGELPFELCQITPLNLQEYKRLKERNIWTDQLPVFKDEKGNLVRPHRSFLPENSPIDISKEPTSILLLPFPNEVQVKLETKNPSIKVPPLQFEPIFKTPIALIEPNNEEKK